MTGRSRTASVARSDDPWLVGDGSAEETPTNLPMRSEVVEEGSGQPVTAGTTVRVHYVASLPDGSMVHDSGNMPSEIVLGSTKMICRVGIARSSACSPASKSVASSFRGGSRSVAAVAHRGIPPRTDVTFLIDLYLPADVSNDHELHRRTRAADGVGR